MKKVLSVFLASLIIFSIFVPATLAAENTYGTIPVVYLRGSGVELVDANGKQIWPVSLEGGNLGDSVKECIDPYLKNALFNDEWEAYYDKVAFEIGEIFSDAWLDENGEASNGSGLGQNRINENNKNINTDKKHADGTYGLKDYLYWYDWRLDPYTVADGINDYINSVLAVTGAEKVALVSHCLGCGFAMAYLAKYGNDKIYSLGFNSSVCSGMEIVSDCYTGDIKLNKNSLVRFEKDCYYLNGVSESEGKFISDLIDTIINDYIDELVDSAVDVLSYNGTITIAAETINWIYEKFYTELVPKLVMTVVGTFPGYWMTIHADSYEKAIKNVFGKPGDEKYEQYKNLIKKLDDYHYNVRLKYNDILLDAKEKGIHIGVVAKYGFQSFPVGTHCDVLSDKFAGVAGASFGATTVNNDQTLSKSYIKNQQKKGLDKYISPDKQIDASTCLFPDSTWFLKGAVHDTYPEYIDNLMYWVAESPEQVTVNDNPLYPQYMVFHYTDPSSYKGEVVPMTKENCDTTAWTSGTKFTYHFGDIIKALIRFFKVLFNVFDVLKAQNAGA